MAVAIHSTRLGPALGGARLWHYDARRRRRRRRVAACTGHDVQGGRRRARAGRRQRRDLCPVRGAARGRRASRASCSTSATWSSRWAVRTSQPKTWALHRPTWSRSPTRTHHVTGMPPERGGTGDPSPFTAIGVQAAMRAACSEAFGVGAISPAARSSSPDSAMSARTWRAASLMLEPKLSSPTSTCESARWQRRLGARWVEPASALEAEVRHPRPVRGRRRDPRRQRRSPPVPRRLRSGEQPARRRGAGRSVLAGEGNPLRARLHRERGRPDQRLPRDPRLRRGEGTQLALSIEGTMARVFGQRDRGRARHRWRPRGALARERLAAPPDR